jgi:hypothetical protein
MYRRPPLTRLSTAILAVTAVALVAGVLATTGLLSGSKSEQGLRGWIYRDSTSAVFVQWTRTGNTVQGSMSVADLDSAEDTSVTTYDVAFTGTVGGHSVSLTFTRLLGSATTVAGQLGGSNSVLSLPQSDGSLQSITLHPAATAEYNADLVALRTTANANQQAADQASVVAAQSAAAAAAQVAANQAVDAAANTLAQAITAASTDVGTLNTDAAAISAVDGPLAQEAQDLATTRADAAQVEKEAESAEPGDATVCSDATGAESEAIGVDSDNAGVQSALTGLASEVQVVQEDQQRLAAAQQQLAQATQADPAYTPAEPLPTDDAVAHAKVALSAALKKAATTTRTATTEGDRLAAAAHTAAAAASRAGSC